MDIKELIGETLKYIDVDNKYQSIRLTTESGRVILIEHDQDCCESVRIEDTEGEWHYLVGRPILEASHDEVKYGDPPPEYPDSWTRTTLTFKTDSRTVISRWIGESNGYYSEDVSLKEIVKGEQCQE